MRTRFIQCLSPFKGGTTQPCENGRVYHFLPNEHGDYVAEVLNDRDYENILSISKGFQPYGEANIATARELEDAKEAADRATVKATQQKIEAQSAIARGAEGAAYEQRQEQNRRNAQQLAGHKDRLRQQEETRKAKEAAQSA